MWARPVTGPGPGATATATAPTATRSQRPGPSPSRFIQGGERCEQIALTTPGSLTLRKAGIHYIADRTQAKDYGGYFVSGSDQLNKIWYAGAYTLQTDLAPAHSLPASGPSWTAPSTSARRSSTTAPGR